MPNDVGRWVLIFSDGTGQRGVREDAIEEGFEGTAANLKNTNVFQLYQASDGRPAFDAFYDAGLGAPAEGRADWWRTLHNLWSKATGWGITTNIVDCYEALVMRWRPGMKIGLFGFSRGAYTVRSLGGVLATCGVATTIDGGPIPVDADGRAAERRRAMAQAAVDAYKIANPEKRRAAGRQFAARHASAQQMPQVVGVFDTVKALGLPGVMNAANPWRHEFHDNELSPHVPLGLQALSIDENRKTFAPVLWDEPDATARAAGQRIEQVWFPGVHSDVGGGYEEQRLADLTLAWMLDRLHRYAGLHIPLTVTLKDNLLAPAHDERTGLGVFWRPGDRSIRAEAVDRDAACDGLEARFDGFVPHYRPHPLKRHPRFRHYY